MDLDWLDDGSLYILLPERLLDVWYRADSDDYNRACAAGDNWLNLLSVGDGVGLVLGGDPGMALAIPDDRGDTVLIRWIFADDEHELVAFALRGEDITETEPDIEFDSPAAHWRLFNAAARLQVDGNPSLRVVLPVGHVRARTAYLRSGPNAAIVHRFSSATPDITLIGLRLAMLVSAAERERSARTAMTCFERRRRTRLACRTPSAVRATGARSLNHRASPPIRHAA